MARRSRLRLVIDTMVLIRGARALRQKPPQPETPEQRIILGWIEELFDWLYTQPILDEYRAVLQRLKAPRSATGRFINLLGEAGTRVEAKGEGSFSPDPKKTLSIIAGSQAVLITSSPIISAIFHRSREGKDLE